MSPCNNTDPMPNNLLHNLSGTSSIYLCQVLYTYTLLLLSWVLCQGPRADKELSRTSNRAQAWCLPRLGPSLWCALPHTPGLFIPTVIQNINKLKTWDSVKYCIHYVLPAPKYMCRKVKSSLSIPWRHIVGSRGIALLILNLGTTCRWVVNIYPYLHPWERTPVPNE
jgi:hypothetical protein